MTKYLKIILLVFICTVLNSCAIQTNVIKSLEDAKKSVLKIERPDLYESMVISLSIPAIKHSSLRYKLYFCKVMYHHII